MAIQVSKTAIERRRPRKTALGDLAIRRDQRRQHRRVDATSEHIHTGSLRGVDHFGRGTANRCQLVSGTRIAAAGNEIKYLVMMVFPGGSFTDGCHTFLNQFSANCALTQPALQACAATETAKLSSSISRLATLSPANVSTMANSLSICLPVAFTRDCRCPRMTAR